MWQYKGAVQKDSVGSDHSHTEHYILLLWPKHGRGIGGEVRAGRCLSGGQENGRTEAGRG